MSSGIVVSHSLYTGCNLALTLMTERKNDVGYTTNYNKLLGDIFAYPFSILVHIMPSETNAGMVIKDFYVDSTKMVEYMSSLSSAESVKDIINIDYNSLANIMQGIIENYSINIAKNNMNEVLPNLIAFDYI